MALLATQVIFCGWVILAKVSVSGGYPVKPIVFCFYRETLSALFMLGIAWHTDGSPPLPSRLPHHPHSSSLHHPPAQP